MSSSNVGNFISASMCGYITQFQPYICNAMPHLSSGVGCYVEVFISDLSETDSKIDNLKVALREEINEHNRG